MTISSLSLVNQKLAYARVLLKVITPVTATANSAERIQRQALLESVVFQLVCGYQHYLRELAENYRVKNFSPIRNESDLLEALNKSERAPSEATELNFLRQQPDSWLAQLHNYYESLWLPPLLEPKSPKPVSLHNDFIHVVVLDIADSAVDRGTFEKIVEWERSFSSLIVRQRETSSEY